MGFDFDTKLAYGRVAEDELRRLHIERGHFVIDSRDYVTAQNVAPRMHGPNGESLLLPDFIISDGRGHTWLEDAKRKRRPLVYDKLARVEHGVDLEHLNDYQAVGRVLNMPVFLTVFEDETGHVLRGLLDKLEENARYYPEKEASPMGAVNYAPMVNFLRSDFMLWEHCDLVIMEGTSVPSLATELRPTPDGRSE